MTTFTYKDKEHKYNIYRSFFGITCNGNKKSNDKIQILQNDKYADTDSVHLATS